ncbi:MAG: ATP-binding cassette domain-containing protein [Pseudomonadota bacterium]
MLKQNIVLPPAAIHIKNVQVQREAFRLSISDLIVPTGEYITLVGGNGAGKSTLIEALLGLADSEVLECLYPFAGEDMSLPSERLGTQLQSLSWNPEFRVADILDLHKAVYGKQSSEAYELLGLSELAPKGIGKTSRGERVRIDLFFAFAHSPDLIMLDEPSTGLDAQYIEALFQLIGDAKNNGATLISATHDPREVAMSDQTWWLENGTVRETGQLSQLLSEHLGSWKGVLNVSDPSSLPGLHEHLEAVGHFGVEQDGAIVIFGDEGLKSIVPGFAERFDLSGWGVSQSTAADLLRHISSQSRAEPRPAAGKIEKD